MSKFKKIIATMIGTTMSANVLLTMPFSAFADNISQTFEFDGYTVGYEVKNSWGNTDVISLTLTNTGTETIEDWMLYFDPNGEIQYVNDAVQMTTTNGIGYIKNPGYNADIDPGASVEFRYAVNDCEEIPDDYKFCQSRMTKETGYDVSLKVNYTWGSNNEYFNGEIIIQNDTDAPIEAWELKVDTNFTITEITNSWAADVTELESYNYMLKGTYTSILPVGGSISLGFNGMKEGEPIISDYSLTEVVVDESVIDSIINGINKDDAFYDDCIDWSTLPDSDGDGLPDEYEEEYGCDPTNPDTDEDGLPDGYEIMTIGSNPADAYSLDSTLSDGEYDNDQDGLSNYEEYILGTDPLRADSDFDGLSDGNEVNVYDTDPLNPDTDGDGLSDGDEIALGLNPLVTDSNGDGISDNEEKFSQDITYNTEDSDTVIDSINVSFEGTGYINSTTSVENIMDTDWMCSNVVGLIGNPYDISSDSSFDTATLTFTVDKSSLGDTQFDDLAVLWYNEEEQRFVEMETIPDVTASTLTTTVEHFSKYLIVDCSRWYEAWSENNYPINGNTLHTAITIDCSSSMIGNDPNNYRITAANSFVDVMNAADLASVIFFADGADEKQELINDQEALKNAIDDVFSAGTTNYTAALRYSIDSLEKQPDSDADDIIIFLSDGRPTGTDAGPGYEISEEDFDYSLVDEAASKGIRIYTIGLTNNVNENILKEMASRTNGEYYYANTAKELISYFLTVNMSEKYDIITDTDEDGIPDLFETYGMPVANGQVLFSDPEVKDTDGDGLEDGEEVIMHIVDDADEVKAAYNYMYGSVPEPFISNNGGIYFTMVANPEKECSADDGINDFDKLYPEKIFDKYKSNLYGNLDDELYNYYDDSEYYNSHLEERYMLRKPLTKYTIEKLYPEFKDETVNNISNAIYYELKDNILRIHVGANFTGALKDEKLEGVLRKKLIAQGINEHWSETYTGTLFDFYPGMVISVEVVIKEKIDDEFYTLIDGEPDYKEFYPSEKKVINIECSDRFGNPYHGTNGINISKGWSLTSGLFTKEEYKGMPAHEFGHALKLADGYEAEENREFYIKQQNEVLEVGIMRHGGNVILNDVEMVLCGAISGDNQAYSPMFDRPLSKAIREKSLYVYAPSLSSSFLYGKEYFNHFAPNIYYTWWNDTSYVPIGDNVIKEKIVTANGEDIGKWFYFVENESTVTILGYEGILEDSNGQLIVPSTILGDNGNLYNVTKIHDSAFCGKSFDKIQLPDTIASIGTAAFYECKNLTECSVPEDVKVIRKGTFQNCENLRSIDIGSGVEIIATSAFYDCISLTGVIIPESVERIGNSAFHNCKSMIDIIIPENVKTIDAYAFNLCWWLNAGSITFYRTNDIDGYNNALLYNDGKATVYVPLESESLYQELFANSKKAAILTISEKGGVSRK